MRAAKAVVALLQQEVAQQIADHNGEELGNKTKQRMKHIAQSSTEAKLRAMIACARSEDGMTCRMSELDADAMCLGVANGMLDLQAQTLRSTTPELLVTQRCRVNYDPDAQAPLFQQFLRQVIPDKDVRKFLRVFFGYTLVGRVEHQLFLFLYGLGANGKSVFIETIRWVLGDYARKIHTEMLMRGQRSPGGPSPDIMNLKGRRLVYANETEEGARLAEARVKELTGSDTLSGRPLYGQMVEFEPSHKLVIVGNHRPEIHDDGYGVWRRVALVEFGITIPEAQRDPQLLEKLKAEGPGILNWMLSGLREYQHNGLVIPNTVKAATDAYRSDMDILGEWLHDACDLKAGAVTNKDTIYDSYRVWAARGGHGQLSKSKLTRRLRDRGVTVAADRRNYNGIQLKDQQATR